MVKVVRIEEELDIPDDVKLDLKNLVITCKGKKGVLAKDFNHCKKLKIERVNKKIEISADFPRKKTIALAKTVKNLILNMIAGVQETYTYKMKIVYSHFPITLEPPKKGSTQILIRNFIGERAPRITYSIGDVTVKANKEEVIVNGCDKETVGQTCANIQRKCKIKNKDKRVFQDGIYVYEKLLGSKQFWVIK
jgi:large subunit ribosomal protein L6